MGETLRNFESLKAEYPVKGGIRRKAAMIGIRDNDSRIRPVPGEIAKVSQRVFDELSIRYEDIIAPTSTAIRRIRKRGYIRSEVEFYLIRDLLSDGAPDEVENFEELERLMGAYEDRAEG